MIGCRSDKNEFTEIHPDHFYKLIDFTEDTNQVQLGSFVQFNWEIRNEIDSNIFSKRLFIRIDTVENQQGLISSLLALKQGYTGAFKFPFTSLEKDFKSTLSEEDFVDTNAVFIHYFHIDKVFTEQEFIAQKEYFLDWINNMETVNFNSIEHQVIDNYIFNENLNTSTSSTGLRQIVYANHSGIKTGFGKHIKIKYHGGSLNRPQQHITTQQDFYIGEEMQVIKAIEEAILKMEKGDSSLIIAPSNLAFGEKGSSTGLIPAATPVIYKIHLLECE